MAIVKMEPFRDIMALQDRINRMFEDSISRSRAIDEPVAAGEWSPQVDIYETGEVIVIKAEVPGIDKKDITIAIKDNSISIKGERKVEKTIKEENYHRVERSYGAFHRMFALPTNIEKDKVKAEVVDGVLEILLPKTEESKPVQIKLK
jgi:HSP20 family protein